MTKVAIGAGTYLYPLPTVLVGANVNGKPNFSTYAWCGIANHNPPMLSIAFMHKRYTLEGVKQNETFSVNIPSVDQVKETDYCGVTSGREIDKVAECKFVIWYGLLKTAPLIEQFPVNLECKVVHTLNLGSHLLVIGQIMEVYVTDSCLTDGRPDVDKINPLIWVTHQDVYRELGKYVGKAFQIGYTIKS